jgi:phosphomethylpyrimidine synthase
VQGSRADIRVPMRESARPTRRVVRRRSQSAVYVYDTSGPYTDPDANIDIRSGLPHAAPAVDLERDDTEELDGPTSDYGRRAWPIRRWPALQPARKPRRAREGQNVTQMHRPPRHHHAGNGIRRHPRKPAPQGSTSRAEGLRPDGQRLADLMGRQHPGQAYGAAFPPRSRRNSCARNRPRPRHHPANINHPKWSR